MKKTFFLFFFFTLFLSSPFAQDTIEIWDVRDLGNCYIPSEWPRFPDDFTYNESLQTYQAFIHSWLQNRRQQAEWGFRVLTDDTLEVYGIAAILCPGNTMANWFDMEMPSDTSSRYSDTWLMLFAAEPDSLRQLVDTSCTYVDGWQTPEHYVKFGWRRPAGTIVEYPPLPLFERYFPQSVTVVDSFYLGYVIPRGHATPPSDISFPRVITADLEVFPCTDTVDFFERIHWKFRDIMFGTDEDFWTAGWSGDVYKEHPLIFPIITPPDTTVNPIDTTVIPIDTVVNPGDTLVVLPGDTLVIGGDTLVNTGDTVIVIPGEPVIIGGDTLVVNPGDSIIVIPGNTDVGIQPNDLIYRYTNVAPNPARNSVRITSSFGISRIEAYDLRGRRIYESPQLSTFSFPLSTIDWPRGTYLLRITTPAGVTTKKLLIQ